MQIDIIKLIKRYVKISNKKDAPGKCSVIK